MPNRVGDHAGAAGDADLAHGLDAKRRALIVHRQIGEPREWSKHEEKIFASAAGLLAAAQALATLPLPQALLLVLQ